MAASTEATLSEESGTILVHGGASIVAHLPVFSPDSKYLLCCCGNLVKVLSVSSGECVRRLIGHEDEVTSIAITHENQFQVFTSSKDKSVITWDYVDGVKLKVYRFKLPIYRVLPYGESNNALVIVRVEANAFHLWSGCFSKSPLRFAQRKTVLTKICTQETLISIGGNNSFVALACEENNSSEKKVVVYRFSSPGNKSNFRTGNVTCIASHPTEECIAIGTKGGKIELWYNLFGKELVKSPRHWHALMVFHVTFSAEGSFFLSGGLENVLVKWPTKADQDSSRNTLPRLGSPIYKIVCSNDNTKYAVCHTDNSIKIISSNFQVIQIFEGLTRAHFDPNKTKEAIPTGLLLDPRTNALVLNGKPGHLQFYSMHNDKQLYNLDIVCQNFVTPESLNKRIVFTEVENAAFHQSGSWLATIERRDDGVNSLEINLKFWEYKDEAQEYELNTNVYLPHTDRVNSMKFKPGPGIPLLVTSSRDTRFKLWTLLQSTDIYGENTSWNSESVGFYRDRESGDVDFSEDGSLLAVAFGPTVTLWDPETNQLRSTLVLPGLTDNIKQVIFGKGPCAHLLVCCTKTRLTVWNLLTTKAVWTVSTKIQVMAADPLTDYVAAFTSDNSLLVFQPNNPEPVYVNKKVSKRQVIGAIFIPHQEAKTRSNYFDWQKSSRIYFMDVKQKLLTIHEDKVCEYENEKDKTVVRDLPETVFSVLMSQRKEKERKQDDSKLEDYTGQAGSKYIAELLSTPSHVLGPVSKLCQGFLSTLMIENKTEMQSENMEHSGEPKPGEASDMEMDDKDVATPMEKEASSISLKGISKDILKQEEKFTLESLDWLKNVI